MLPDTSQGSPTKGIWFVHNDGINTIRVFTSSISKEKIFLNEDLVSEHRNIKLKSAHEFQDKNDNTYEVELVATKLLKGEMECLIYRNKELIKTFKASPRIGNNFTIKRFSILIIASVTFAIISSQFEFPDFVFYIFLFLMLTVHTLTRDPGEISIVEDKKNNE
ncbi:hypothetical protein H2O64_08745 [Kordia sp. YSTF-M3]|uniref:Uncharacterized protein n=1 Tax=Kordia aestuariivivens TaxID=2759037 RepID=A0ABR7Q857_9FLAO|nr:hypothetical protein [Kordia aestuariivivens]MBC8754756.1 hypothetical protein [Kordia aestuariivivens]